MHRIAACFVLLTTLATSSYASILATVEKVCPLDGETFNAQIAVSGTSFGQRFDLKKIGPIYQPWPVPVCPTSGFVMYRDDFTKKELSLLQEYVLSSEFQQIKDNNTPYYLAGKMSEQLGLKNWPRLWLMLAATWESESISTELNIQYLHELEPILIEYARTLLPSTDEWLTGELLLANLYRRLGKFELAKAHARTLLEYYRSGDQIHIATMLKRLIQFIDKGDTEPHAAAEETEW